MALRGDIGRILFVRLYENDDVAEAIKKKAQENNVKAGVFLLIGALKHAALGCYKEGEYVFTRLDSNMEVASCMGNIALDEKGEILVHAHMVVTNEKGEASGGHLMKGCLVSPTAELVIIEATGVNLRKAFDPKTKLNLLQLT